MGCEMNAETNCAQSRLPPSVVAILLVVWTAYALARLMMIPADGAVTGGFSHDSGYISTLAEEVRDGRGYQNRAHWLVFLNPERLPMPSHNANPGYPTMIAGVSLWSGKDVVWSGLAVSALASAALGWVVFALVRRFTGGWIVPASSGLAVVFFPMIWRLSFCLLPDALCLTLSIGVLVAVAHGRKSWHFAVAGLLLGLCWLVRSTGLLIWPPVVFWMFRTRGRRQWIRQTLVLAGVAVLTASPWLIHTHSVWGSPFRSDAGYYWLQDYYARAYGGDVWKFLRSLDPPPSLGDVLAKDASGFTRHVLGGLPALVHNVMADMTQGDISEGFLLLALLVGAAGLSRKVWASPEWQAGAMIVVLGAGALLPRPQSVEARYLAVVVAILVIWAAVSTARCLARPDFGRPKVFCMMLVLMAGIYVSLFLPRKDLAAYLVKTRRTPESVVRRAVMLQVAAGPAQGRPVVTDQPYLYAFFTKTPALSPPAAGKQRLLAFMERYGARHLLLPESSINYFYPAGEHGLQPEIRLQQRKDGFLLFERVQPQ